MTTSNLKVKLIRSGCYQMTLNGHNIQVNRIFDGFWKVSLVVAQPYKVYIDTVRSLKDAKLSAVKMVEKLVS